MKNYRKKKIFKKRRYFLRGKGRNRRFAKKVLKVIRKAAEVKRMNQLFVGVTPAGTALGIAYSSYSFFNYIRQGNAAFYNDTYGGIFYGRIGQSIQPTRIGFKGSITMPRPASVLPEILGLPEEYRMECRVIIFTCPPGTTMAQVYTYLNTWIGGGSLEIPFDYKRIKIYRDKHYRWDNATSLWKNVKISMKLKRPLTYDSTMTGDDVSVDNDIQIAFIGRNLSSYPINSVDYPIVSGYMYTHFIDV